jgi:hypothetical protein
MLGRLVKQVAADGAEDHVESRTGGRGGVREEPVVPDDRLASRCGLRQLGAGPDVADHHANILACEDRRQRRADASADAGTGTRHHDQCVSDAPARERSPRSAEWWRLRRGRRRPERPR